MERENRIIGYDCLRIIATFMVIAIHSNVIYLANNLGSVGWYFIMELTALCVIAVPVFIMISGAMLLDCGREIGIRELFFKRVSKQAIPFAIWSIVYVLIRVIMGKIPLNINSFVSLIKEPAYYQFWFMYTLLAIYLLLPVLQKIVIHASKKQIEYILILWLVFSVFVPMVSHFIPALTLSSHVDLILCEGYIGYFILGYYIKKYPLFKNSEKNWCLILVGILITGSAAIIEWVVFKESNYEGYVYSAYLLPGVVLSAMGVFNYAGQKQLNLNEKLEKIVVGNSRLSLGIFYVHMLVLTGLEYLGITGTNSIGVLIVKIVLTYLISLLISYVISKIKYLRPMLLGLNVK